MRKTAPGDVVRGQGRHEPDAQAREEVTRCHTRKGPDTFLWLSLAFRQHGVADPDTTRVPEQLVLGILLFHLPLAATLITLLRGARWFTSGVALAIFGYSWGAACISTMSVTGSWL
jgi:hypothetical protein